ncbi:DUF4012 domain-containing protein [Patescibacteria group bacterium]|nr:DUF4012 domain-containing protein [Patescibacteria group bacterium]
MPSKLTTYQIDDKPNIAWLVADGLMLTALNQCLEVGQFQHQISLINALPQNWLQSLTNSYKVVVLVTPKQLFDQLAQIKSLAKKLGNQPLTFVIPVLAELSGQDLPSAWHQQYDFQNQVLGQVLLEFPLAQIVLLQEAILLSRPWLLPNSSYLCLCDLHKLILYSIPAMPCSISLKEALMGVLGILSRPHSGQSHLFGSKQNIGDAVQRAGLLYEQMYQVEAKVTKLAGSKPKIPSFITQEHSLVGQISTPEVLTNIVQNTPSPTQDQVVPTWYNVASSFKPNSPLGLKVNPEIVEKIQPDSAKISGEISNLFRTQRIKQKQTVITDLTQQEIVFRHKRTSRRWFFYGGLGFVGAGLGVLFLILVFWLSERSVRGRFIGLASSTIASAEYNQSSWEKLLNRSSLLNWQAESYSQLIENPIFEQSRQLVMVIEQWDTVQKSLQEATEIGQNLAEAVLGSNDESVAKLAENSLVVARQAHADLSKLEASLNQALWLTQNQDGDESFGSWLSQVHQRVFFQQQVASIFEALTNQSPKQQWLILFQNNQELRPTGGFIQAVNLVTLDGGKINSFSGYSSYQIDENLPGQVVPPDEIKQHLGENNWYFRDSNWDANFPSSAVKSAWFVEKSLNTKLDGVLAITPPLLGAMLDVIGPVDLPEFNEVITGQNLTERLEFHSGVKLVDGANQPDYSTLLLNKIMMAIQGLSGDKAGQLATAIGLGLQNQEMLIYPINQSISSALSDLGWMGQLLSPSCPSQFSNQNCRVDLIMQVESNVGVNKANAYLDRKIDHQVVLDGQTASHTRKITFNNRARTSAWPKGPYKTYIRFYLPTSAQVDSVWIDGRQLAGSDVVSYIEHQRLVVGVSMVVDVNSRAELLFKYHLPQPLEKGSAYLFFDQKQPGRGKTEMSLEITHSTQLTVQAVAPQAEFDQTKVIFKPDTSQSSFSGIQF